MVELRIRPMFEWLAAVNAEIDPTYTTDGLKRLHDWGLAIPDLAAVCQRVADLYAGRAQAVEVWSSDEAHRERYNLLFNWYVRRQVMRATRCAPARDELVFELNLTNGARDPGWSGLERMQLVPDYGLNRTDLARLLEIHARRHGYVSVSENFNLIGQWYEDYRMIHNEGLYKLFVGAYTKAMNRPMEVSRAIFAELPK